MLRTVFCGVKRTQQACELRILLLYFFYRCTRYFKFFSSCSDPGKEKSKESSLPKPIFGENLLSEFIYFFSSRAFLTGSVISEGTGISFAYLPVVLWIHGILVRI